MLDSSSVKQLLFRRLPPFIYAIFIFTQSSFPSVAGKDIFPHMDKGLHALGYGLMGILVYRALITIPGMKKGTILTMLSICIATLYGVSDEVHQSFVPSRSADIADVLADMTGSALGVTAYIKAKLTI